jgi:hypothetical protein
MCQNFAGSVESESCGGVCHTAMMMGNRWHKTSIFLLRCPSLKLDLCLVYVYGGLLACDQVANDGAQMMFHDNIDASVLVLSRFLTNESVNYFLLS